MSTLTRGRLTKLVFPAVVWTGISCVSLMAQTPAPSPVPRKAVAPQVATRVIVENKATAPQVVTILHRLNGLKVLNLLKWKEQFEVIAKLDPNFQLSGDMHTNVIAGVTLDDGRIIAAWLPEAEAELPSPSSYLRIPRTPRATAVAPPPAPGAPQTAPPMPALPPMPEMQLFNLPAEMWQPADLKVIMSDGKRIVGRYIGIDGLTGLSLIALPGENSSQTSNDKEEKIEVGQKLRVLGPQPVPGAETGPRSPIYIRIGETEATVVSVTRSPSGGVARVKIRSAKFSPANIGGIAINEANETLGIVDGVEGGEASIVPLSLVRMAAKRVVARQASVPRPWLGIRGEPIGAVSLEKIVQTGWELERARALAEKQQGIMLTFVAPGSPAALANLKPGDVILSVNNGSVRNVQEFSWQLDEATPDHPVHFTVARPEKAAFEAMEIKLSESPDPMFPRRYQRDIKRDVKVFKRFSLQASGIETVALKPSVASRFGSTGGLLVVAVEPSTDAFKAGLRPGDLIEVIDGQPVYTGNTVSVSVNPGARTTCTVVRNKAKLTLSFRYSVDSDKDKDKDEKDKDDDDNKP
jgi:S1-C subfamily serine protease